MPKKERRQRSGKIDLHNLNPPPPKKEKNYCNKRLDIIAN